METAHMPQAATHRPHFHVLASPHFIEILIRATAILFYFFMLPPRSTEALPKCLKSLAGREIIVSVHTPRFVAESV
jgi:hypothetical protein